MSFKKVSELNELISADDADLLLISDQSESESKKITVANLIGAPVDAAVAALVDSAPATLDTLNELAAALGDDANFSTTVTTNIGTKWTQDNTKISNWDTAYSWGNHASAGYLTSYTETDPVVGAVTGIVKADGAGNISAATAGTDYATAAQGALADSALQDVVDDTTPQLGGTLDTNGNPIDGTTGVAVQYGGSTKLATTNTGIDVTGTITVNGIEITGGASIGDEIALGDNKKITFGADNDLEIYHDAAVSGNNVISSPVKDLNLQSGEIGLWNGDGTTQYIRCKDYDTYQKVDLLYSGATKLSTKDTGVNVVGSITTDGASLDGAVVINEAGADVDFRVESDTNTHAFFLDGATGNVGIGTSSPTTTKLQINYTAASENGLRLYGTNAAQNNAIQMYDASSNYITQGINAGAYTLAANGTERFRIDSSGRLLVGTSSARSNFFNSTVSSALQIEGSAVNDRIVSIVSSINDVTSSGRLILAHQRSGTVGGNTIVLNGDAIGGISFQGSDGSEFVPCADITAQIDGTPGANDMPGRLVFSTTADGASSPTERMRLTSTGDLHVDGDVIAYSTTISDERLKENIEVVTDATSKLKQIRGVTFTRKDSGEQSAGVIAQEIEKILPQAVKEKALPLHTGTEDLYKTVEYDALHAVLIEAVKELTARVEQLEKNNG